MNAATIKTSIALLAVVLSAWSGRADATATPVTLGSAADYGILLGAGDTLSLDGKFNLAGNLGVGQNSTLNVSNDTNAINGDVSLDSNVQQTGSGNLSVSGNTVTASMTQAISDANAAAASAEALAATPGLAFQNSAISVNGGSVTIKALTNLSENVLDISSLSLTNGTITFDDNGYTGAKFIVNVTGGFKVNSTGHSRSVIQGVNGATGADILFNIENTGPTVSLTGTSSNQTIGTILAPQRNVTLGDGGSLTGALIAGVNNAGKSYTVTSQHSGFNLSDLHYTPRVAVSNVPEPSSIAPFGAGLLALAGLRRRRRRR